MDTSANLINTHETENQCKSDCGIHKAQMTESMATDIGLLIIVNATFTDKATDQGLITTNMDLLKCPTMTEAITDKHELFWG